MVEILIAEVELMQSDVRYPVARVLTLSDGICLSNLCFAQRQDLQTQKKTR